MWKAICPHGRPPIEPRPRDHAGHWIPSRVPRGDISRYHQG
jgi:hypothetical protein